nr:hypothetical protein [Pandoravirus massiliensis]
MDTSATVYKDHISDTPPMSTLSTAPATASVQQSAAGDRALRVRKRKCFVLIDTSDTGLEHNHHRDGCGQYRGQRRMIADCPCGGPEFYDRSATHDTLRRLRSIAPVDPDAPLEDARPHASAHTNLVALLRWVRAVLYEDDVPDDAIGPREGTDAERDRSYKTMRAASRAFAASAAEWRSIGAAPGRVRDATHGNEIVARALLALERLEAGMCAVAADTHSAACARLEAVAAVRRLSLCYTEAAADADSCTDSAPWCRAVAVVGTAYRSAMRRRLVRIYVAYAPTAVQVDHLRDMGDQAPDGDIPTPRSAKAWFAARGRDVPAAFGIGGSSDGHEGVVSCGAPAHAHSSKRVRLAPPVHTDRSK